MNYTPDSLLHPVITQSVLRYLRYGWKNAIILDLIRFRYGVKLRGKCVNHLRDGTACTKKCLETCVLR